MDAKYLILSPKLSKTADHYWGPERCGYTTKMYLAGIYGEEDVKRITESVSSDGAKPIRIDEKVAEGIRKSIDIERILLLDKLSEITKRYQEDVDSITKQICELAQMQP